MAGGYVGDGYGEGVVVGGGVEAEGYQEAHSDFAEKVSPWFYCGGSIRDG